MALALSQLLTVLLLTDPGARESCPRRPPAPEDAPAIPKTLHVIWWPGKELLPKHLQPNLGSWATLHPSWEVRVWSEKMALDLVARELPWFIGAYKKISTVGKHDIARYAILYHLGGVAANADVAPLQPLDSTLQGRDMVIFGAREDVRLPNATVTPAIMAAAPGHPLVRRMLNSTEDEANDSLGGARLQGIIDSCTADAAATAECDAEGRCAPAAAAAADPPCGCFTVLAGPEVSPFHPALSTSGHAGPEAHLESARAFARAVAAGAFPPASAVAVQYTLDSWIASADSVTALVLRGVARAQQGDDADAADTDLAAVVWYWWGDRYKYPPPGSALAPDVKAAKKAYKRALELRPGLAAAQFELGHVHREKGRKLLAVDHYAKAYRLDPDNYLYCNNLGVALLSLGRWAEAETLFRTALGMQDAGGAPVMHLDAKTATMENLGKALEAQGRVAEALPLYRHVLRRGTPNQQSRIAPRIAKLEDRANLEGADTAAKLLDETMDGKKRALTLEEADKIKRDQARDWAERTLGARAKKAPGMTKHVKGQ